MTMNITKILKRKNHSKIEYLEGFYLCYFEISYKINILCFKILPPDYFFSDHKDLFFFLKIFRYLLF